MRAIVSLGGVLATMLLLAAPVAADEDLRSTISVVGEGRVLVQPDVAMVALGVEATGPTLSAAQDEASTRMQAVIDAFLAQGVARDDIRTSRLSVTPVYDQRDRTQIRGYTATNAVQAKVRDLGRVGAIVDAATTAGANRVDGIAFAVDDVAKFKDQARVQAMANARAKADQLASLAGMRVVGVKSISESDAVATPVRARSEVQAAPAPAAAPPPVEPGLQEIQTQVAVTYIVQ